MLFEVARHRIVLFEGRRAKRRNCPCPYGDGERNERIVSRQQFGILGAHACNTFTTHVVGRIHDYDSGQAVAACDSGLAQGKCDLWRVAEFTRGHSYKYSCGPPEETGRVGTYRQVCVPQHPVRYAYELTEKGKALRGVLLALVRWGRKHIQGTDSRESSAAHRAKPKTSRNTVSQIVAAAGCGLPAATAGLPSGRRTRTCN